MAKIFFINRATKWGTPLKNIIFDYAEVIKDIGFDSKKHPVKYLTWCLLGGVIVAFHKKRPDLKSYESEVLEYSNELGLCAASSINLSTKRYIDDVSTLLCDGCITHVNLGICSLIVRRPYSIHCSNYHQVCSHLQSRIWTFHHRVIDIGIWNKWLVLNKTMVDFDVNNEEFKTQVS